MKDFNELLNEEEAFYSASTVKKLLAKARSNGFRDAIQYLPEHLGFSNIIEYIEDEFSNPDKLVEYELAMDYGNEVTISSLHWDSNSLSIDFQESIKEQLQEYLIDAELSGAILPLETTTETKE
jgi:hypothetical protein